MDFKYASLFAALFGSALAFDANADGRIVLTSTELDDVTAVARYTPEQVGELREETDDPTSELERLRREVVPNMNRDVSNDPARPVSADHTMPAMAATPPPATPAPVPAPAVTTPSLPAVTSVPPTPTRHASVSPSLSDAHGSTARQPSTSSIRHQEGTPVTRASTSEAVARAAIRSSLPDQPGPRELAVMGRRPEPALRDTIRQVRSEAPWMRRVVDPRSFSQDRMFSPPLRTSVAGPCCSGR